jgi:hypothetical protein
VASWARAGTKSEEVEVETELVVRVTPLRLLCDTPSGVSLVIILPISFTVLRGKGLDCVSLSELHESKAVVAGYVLRPSVISGGEDDGSLFFTATMLGETIKASGITAQPCAPTMTMTADGTPKWQFPIFTLTTLHSLHWLDWKLGREALVTVKQPYRNSSGSAIFIIDGTESEGVPAAVAAANTAATAASAAATEAAAAAGDSKDGFVDCPVCAMSWPAKMMPHHMGAHLLEGSWASYEKEKPRMPCMLCGVNTAIGQFMEDPSATNSCPISLTAGSKKGVMKPKHQCKIVGTLEYSLTSAGRSTCETPCTNRPLKCQHCTLVFASYSMAQHYSDEHSTTTIPTRLMEQVALGKHERAHVLQLLTQRRVSTVCKGITCCPKAAKA